MPAEHLTDGGLNNRSDFDYDRYGNRYRPSAGTQNSQLFYTPVELSEINQQTNRYTPLSPASVTYDGAGNITAEQKFRQWRYGYDANSRVVHSSDVDGLAVSTAGYDSAGQRTHTTIGPEWHHFIYDALGRVIAEYGIEGWTRDRIYRGGEMLATVESRSLCRKTLEQFVQAFYWGVLGRFATASELSEWVNRLRQADAARFG